MKDKKLQKLLNKVIELYYLSEQDEMIFANSYFEFGERSIRLIDPKNMTITYNKTGDELYGENILEPVVNKMKEGYTETISLNEFAKELGMPEEDIQSINGNKIKKAKGKNKIKGFDKCWFKDE